MIHEITLRVSPEEAGEIPAIRKQVSRKLRIPERRISDIKIRRKSIDARKRQIWIELALAVATDGDRVASEFQPEEFTKLAADVPVAIIVGAGPAGLFAALRSIQLGIRPVILERGRDVERRRVDLAQISRVGKINPVSNYCFGEGGAGAYSDGKLFTRSKKRGNVRQVLNWLVQHGASENILIEAHPHIGSDRLPNVIKNIRESIIDAGGEIHFETCVDRLIIEDGEVKGVETVGGEKYYGDAVIIATGHSAHDTMRSLHSQGMAMEPKGIAVGVRLEHPQEVIDRMQYHSPEGRGKWLPPAEYSFVTQVDGRGVYSFCMCPGGVIVPAGSADGELVVNGMSASARAGRWANSGMVVELRPEDIEKSHGNEALSMLAFQESLEKKIFEEMGRTIVAPAQRVPDFIKGRVSASLPKVSYAPGVRPGDFNSLLPEGVASRLRKGLQEFGKKSASFIGEDAVMIGLESRTSSPVRMVRDEDNLNSAAFNNVYPCGEGAGYAGGIVSAAIDGIRCAEAIGRRLNLDGKE